LSTSILKLRELLHSDDSGEWGESPTGTNDLLILRAGNIADETWLDLSDVVHRTIAEPKRTKLLLREGDILLERSGGTDTRPVGRVGFVDRDMEAGFSNFLHRLRVNRTIADPSYVRFVLAHWHRSGRAIALQTQTTGIRNLMFSRYLDEPIRLPGLINQRKLASILEAATVSLARTDALIAAKREQKRGLTQQLLRGKVRFPGFNEPWKTVRLGDVANEVTARNKGRLGIERVRGVIKGAGLLPMRERVMASDLSRYQIVAPNAFAYNPMRLNIGSIAINEEPTDCLVSPDYVVFQTDGQRLRPQFLNYYRHAWHWEKFVQRAGSGSVRTRIYFEDLAELALRLPDAHEQDRIVRCLDAISREVQLLEAQRAALADQRRGLMDKLLAGEIDIPHNEETAA
jgi:type I restriction enzyme S subunit